MIRSKGMSGHQSAAAKNYEWLTPPSIINALGTFDLDPCAPVTRPWSTALNHFTIEDDGLNKYWDGRVWLNPPFGKYALQWMKKMGQHDNGIALLPARTETAMFQQYIFPVAASILFIKGRPHFHYVTGKRAPFNSGAPIVLISYGDENINKLEHCGIEGKHVLINRTTAIVVTNSPSWKKVVYIALIKLGSKADVSQIYEMVEAIAPDKTEKNIHYKEKIRQKLQEHFERVGKGIYTVKN